MNLDCVWIACDEACLAIILVHLLETWDYELWSDHDHFKLSLFFGKWAIAILSLEVGSLICWSNFNRFFTKLSQLSFIVLYCRQLECEGYQEEDNRNW